MTDELIFEDGRRFLETLGVTESLVREGLKNAISQGADDADLFFEYRSTQQLGLLDDAVPGAML